VQFDARGRLERRDFRLSSGTITGRHRGALTGGAESRCEGAARRTVTRGQAGFTLLDSWWVSPS